MQQILALRSLSGCMAALLYGKKMIDLLAMDLITCEAKYNEVTVSLALREKRSLWFCSYVC